MIHRESEGSKNAERYRLHAVRAASSLGILALLASDSQNLSEKDYFLPQLNNYQVSNHLKSLALVTPTYDSENLFNIEYDHLPPEYSGALHSALQNPVVVIGAESHTYNQIGVRLFQEENGSWDYRTSTVNILLSENTLTESERIYSDSRIVSAAAEHEVLHSINEKWYSYLRPSAIGMNNPYDYLTMSADQERRRGIQIAASTYEPICPIDTTNITSAEFACDELPLFVQHIDNEFNCIDEGHVLQDLYAKPNILPFGHPYDNITEAGSSVILSIDKNPLYVKDCLSDETNMMTDPLKKLSSYVVRLAFAVEPKLEEYLREDALKADTIDWLLQATES